MDSIKPDEEQQQQQQIQNLNESQKKRNRNKSNSQVKPEMVEIPPDDITPIEDAMKAVSLAPHQQINYMPLKTPVSVLQELLSRQGITPSYELIRVVNILNRYSDLKDVRVPILTNQHVGKVSQFHKSLKARFGKTLADLQTTCLNDKEFNFVHFLQEIANEHQFEVTYVDIEEKTYSGRCQCLVQLSTLPVAVCQGSGVTAKDAQSHAARNALEFLCFS